METPRTDIQIIIPVYNAEKTLDKCIHSILAQSYPHWQAIFVDDCSKDNSTSVIEAYAATDSRIVLVKNPKNSGVSATRNAGLALLSAKYVAFLDADDWWTENTLAHLLHIAETKNADIVQGRFTYNYENGKEKTPKGAFSKDVFLTERQFQPVWLRMMTGINMNHVWGKLIKREVLGDLTFDHSYQTGEDLVFCIGLFDRASTYYFTDTVLCHYNRAGSTLTGSALSFKKKWTANQRIAHLLKKQLPKWQMNKIRYRLLASCRTVLIMCSKIVRTLREKI